MKLSDWAKKQGISYRTALRWFHGGTLPVEAGQMSTGTIIVMLETIFEDQRAALYARKSRFLILRLFASLNLPFRRNYRLHQ
jgi:putative resolvase